MILFTAGYPWSGKTELVKMITSGLDKSVKVVLVNPALLRPPEYSQMSPEDQRAARLASWEVAQEQLTEAIIKEPQSTLIIYDSCAAKYRTMFPHFNAAKQRNHAILYVFVGANVGECKGRAGVNWPSQDVISGYATDFGESAPRLRPLCSYFKFIKNMNDPNMAVLKSAASELIKVVLNVKANRIQESSPARSTISRA